MAKFVILVGRSGSGKTYFHRHYMPQRIPEWDAALAKDVYTDPSRDFWMTGGVPVIESALRDGKNVVIEVQDMTTVPATIVQLADFVVFTSESAAMNDYIDMRFIYNADHGRHARLALNRHEHWPSIVINNQNPRLSTYTSPT